jgi:Secretion system C-terminal sorting domain
MFKRLVLISLSILILGSICIASDVVLLEPKKLSTERGPVVMGLDEMDDIFYLERITSDSEYYLSSGSVGDTMLVVFQPLAPCSIYFAQQQWFSAGNYQSFIWEYNAACMNQDDPDDVGYAVGRSPGRGASPESPVGDLLFGPYGTAAEGDNSWEDMFVSGDLPDGGVWIEDGRMFCVGWVKTQDDGLPQPLADDVTARGFQYTWFGGPWMAEEDYLWGSYSSGTPLDIMMRVGVSYPLGAPPMIGSMNQLPNTINAEKVCNVECSVIDDNGWTTDTAILNVSINGGTATEIAMTDADNDNIFEAEFDLGALGVAVDDAVAYWIEATDDEGGVNSIEDGQLSFDMVVLGASEAGILIVDMGIDDRTRVLTQYLWDNDVYFQYWNTDDNKGIDEYTVNLGWDAVMAFGYGGSAIPTRDGANAFSAYLDGGGNIMLSDMDYFFANGEPDEPVFAAGDFAYDYFGIASGFSDPAPTDTSFYGVGGDPISNDFEDDPLYTYAEYSGDWADYFTGITGTVDIFSGENTGSVFGVSYDRGDGKSVYLGFDLVSACVVEWIDPEYGDVYLLPSEQFTTVMDNVFAYFGTTSAPETGESLPMEFSLSQNYPNPFNPSTQITFAVSEASFVSVKVFNLVGQEVATLFNHNMTPGSKTITFDASDLTSGIYFYKMDAGTFSTTRKMILMK